LIRLDHVSKRFGAGHAAVADLSLEIPTGVTCMLVGPSGCGKTTTLKMINRLIEHTSGTILFNGKDIAQEDPVQLRRSMGYVIQQAGLFPHLTVGDNIGTVPRLLGWKPAQIRARIAELVDLVDLDPAIIPRLPRELSGGQQQRVGVARALAADPPVMLMDEPFGALDPITRQRLQEELRRLQKRVKKTIVFVTHDVEEAVILGDRIAVLNVGGILEQFDTPARILGRPASAFVADFLGKDRQLRRLSLMSVADADLLSESADGLPEVSSSSNLRSALDEMLETGQRRLAVRDSDGTIKGVLTLEAIMQMSRAV
jgi:osmoprotectant transport system ATP-binding protein